MPITASSFALGQVQPGGRTTVTETHLDVPNGVSVVREYLAAPAADYVSIMAARAVQISAELAQGEALKATFAYAAGLAPVQQTKAQLVARVWLLVLDLQNSGNWSEFSRVMYWLTEKLNLGDLTDAQAVAAFNAVTGRALTGAQWTLLRSTRITNAHDRWANILAETAL